MQKDLETYLKQVQWCPAELLTNDFDIDPVDLFEMLDELNGNAIEIRIDRGIIHATEI